MVKNKVSYKTENELKRTTDKYNKLFNNNILYMNVRPACLLRKIPQGIHSETSQGMNDSSRGKRIELKQI